MTPDGVAHIGMCGRCDEPVMVTYVEGRKMKLSTRSVPLRDAIILAKYLEWVVNLFPDHATKYHKNNAENPVRFYASLWWRKNERPSQGTLHVKHCCKARR